MGRAMSSETETRGPPYCFTEVAKTMGLIAEPRAPASGHQGRSLTRGACSGRSPDFLENFEDLLHKRSRRAML